MTPQVPAADAPDTGRSVRATFKGIGAVVAPTSAVTALLYYFGWTRTMVEANRLGLDDSLLGYSTQDYLLRSVSSMYAPVVIGLTGTLLAIGLHAVVVAWAHRFGLASATGRVGRPGRRRIAALVIALAVVGLASLALGYAGTRVGQQSRAVYVAAPAAVTVGFLVLVYAAGLYRRFLASRGPERAIGAPAGYDGIVVASVVMLVMAGLFWNVSRYAVVKGNELADTVEARMPQRPGVIIYSAKRLYLQAPVVETKLDPENASYKYAYSGLRLLFRSDSKYFLRPSDTAARVNIVIPDGLDIRLELFHP